MNINFRTLLMGAMLGVCFIIILHVVMWEVLSDFSIFLVKGFATGFQEKPDPKNPQQ
jgi:hypothetical protein